MELHVVDIYMPATFKGCSWVGFCTWKPRGRTSWGSWFIDFTVLLVTRRHQSRGRSQGDGQQDRRPQPKQPRNPHDLHQSPQVTPGKQGCFPRSEGDVYHMSNIQHRAWHMTKNTCVCISERVCVCVCHTLSLRVKRNSQTLKNKQGGAEHSGDCTQRSYPLVPEAGPDQPCVPAGSDSISLLCLPRARLLQVFTGGSWVFKNTGSWPFALPLPCMIDFSLRFAIWLCLAIKQVCVCVCVSVLFYN